MSGKTDEGAAETIKNLVGKCYKLAKNEYIQYDIYREILLLLLEIARLLGGIADASALDEETKIKMYIVCNNISTGTVSTSDDYFSALCPPMKLLAVSGYENWVLGDRLGPYSDCSRDHDTNDARKLYNSLEEDRNMYEAGKKNDADVLAWVVARLELRYPGASTSKRDPWSYRVTMGERAYDLSVWQSNFEFTRLEDGELWRFWAESEVTAGCSDSVERAGASLVKQACGEVFATH